MRHYGQFSIDGQWVDPINSRPFALINPATEEPFATVALGSAEDVDAAVRAARRHLEIGAVRSGRSLADFPVVFVTTLGLGDSTVGAHWIRSWFAPGQPFLNYPSASNLRWLKEAGFDLPETHDPSAIPETEAHRIAGIEKHFHFYADEQSAVQALTEPA